MSLPTPAKASTRVFGALWHGAGRFLLFCSAKNVSRFPENPSRAGRNLPSFADDGAGRFHKPIVVAVQGAATGRETMLIHCDFVYADARTQGSEECPSSICRGVANHNWNELSVPYGIGAGTSVRAARLFCWDWNIPFLIQARVRLGRRLIIGFVSDQTLWRRRQDRHSAESGN